MDKNCCWIDDEDVRRLRKFEWIWMDLVEQKTVRNGEGEMVNASDQESDINITKKTKKKKSAKMKINKGSPEPTVNH